MSDIVSDISRILQERSRNEQHDEQRKVLNNRIVRLLASANITLPPGTHRIPLSKLDAALTGMKLEERMTLKSMLINAGMLEVGE